MLGDVWRWAGKLRTSERNLGIAFYEIPVALRQLLDDTKAWIEYKTYPPDEIAVRFHHRLVQIHPFPKGNGRHARLMADLLVMRLGGERFSWEARICRMPARCASVISPPCRPPTIMTSVRCWHSRAHRFPCRCCSPPSAAAPPPATHRHQRRRCPSPRHLLNGPSWVTCLGGSESASPWT